MRNLITDVPGLKVGHAEDFRLGSGTTAVVFDAPAVGSIDVRGGGPGTRETALLDPAQTVEGIDAIVLSGGSAFGLEAGGGVQAFAALVGDSRIVELPPVTQYVLKVEPLVQVSVVPLTVPCPECTADSCILNLGLVSNIHSDVPKLDGFG